MGRIGFHTNKDYLNKLPTRYLDNKTIFQVFLGLPGKNDFPKISRIINNNNKFYLHSKYVGNIIDRPIEKLKIIDREIQFLRINNQKTGTVLHLNTFKDRLKDLLQVVNNISKYHNSNMIIIETPDELNQLGSTLEDLIFLSRRTLVSFCIDTAHLYVTGHDVSSYEGMINYFIDFFVGVGIDRLKLIHLNDTVGKLFSCYKPHEVIGNGNIFDIKIHPPTNLDIIYVLNKFFEIDIVFERRSQLEFNEEIDKFINRDLSKDVIDKILNDISNRLIISYFSYFSKNLYNRFKASRYYTISKEIKESNIEFYKDTMIKSFDESFGSLDLTEKMKNRIYFIAKNFKSDMIVHPKIPFISDKDFSILNEHGYHDITNIKENINKVKSLINNKRLFKMIKYIDIVNPVERKYIKGFVDKITNKKCIAVGSYIRESEVIKDLDILVTNDEIPNLIKRLNERGTILTKISDGKRYKRFIYKIKELSIVIIIDIFIVDEITNEYKVNYSLSRYDNKLYRSIAKNKGMIMNFSGIYKRSTKNKIKYNNLDELKKILEI